MMKSKNWILGIVVIIAIVLISFNIINKTTPNALDDKCKLEPEAGPCKASFTRYYFDQREGICKIFYWGGCQGVIPFETLEQCQEICEK